MAQRFDNISSANNVQQVGEGQAYVVDRQKSPLLALGEMALNSKMARDKEDAKANKAASTQLRSTDFGDPGMFAGHLADHINGLKQTFLDAKGSPEAYDNANREITKTKGYSYTAKALTDNLRDFDNQSQQLVAAGKLDQNKADKIKAGLLDRISKTKYADLHTIGDPRALINGARKASNSEMAQAANDVGTVTKQVVDPVNGGFKTEITKNTNPEVIQGEIDRLWQNRDYKNRANETIDAKLSANPNQLSQYMKPVTDGAVLTGKEEIVKGNNGKDYIFDRSKAAYDEHKADFISKLDSVDKDSFSQKWQAPNWYSGLGISGGGKNAKYQINPAGDATFDHTGTDVNGGISTNTYNHAGGITINSTNTGMPLITHLSNNGGIVTEREDGVASHATTVQNNPFEIDKIAPGFVAHQNNIVDGKANGSVLAPVPAMSLKPNVAPTKDNYIKVLENQLSKMTPDRAKNYLASLKVGAVGLGTIVEKKNVQATGGEYEYNDGGKRLTKKGTKALVHITENDMNAIATATKTNINRSTILNTQEGRAMQEALQEVKSKRARSGGGAINGGAMSKFNSK